MIYDFDPQNPETVYARTRVGIFKSTIGGADWTLISQDLPAGAVLSLLIDPSRSQTLYACVGSGPGCDTYESTDDGESWSLFLVTLPERTSQGLTAIDPNNSQVLYANGFYIPPLSLHAFCDAFRSTDGGANWTALNISCGTIVVDPQNSEIIYRWGGEVGIGTSSVSKSVDGGASWKTIFTTRGVRSLTIDPSNSQVLYVGVDPDSVETTGLWKSPDGGDTWIPILDGEAILNLAIDPSNSQILYAVSDFGLYKTRDGGTTWTPVPALEIGHYATRLLDIAVHPARPETLLIASSDGVYKSTDRGETWAESNSGLIATGISSLALSASNPQILYATTGAGRYEDLLYKKTIDGQSWEFIGEVIDEVPSLNVPRGGNQSVLLVDPTNPDVLYVEGLKSSDGGRTWETIGGRPFWAASAIVMDPTNPRVLYAANEELPDGYDNVAQQWIPRAAITKTSDGGHMWTVVYTDEPVCGLALAPSDPQIVYASERSTFGYSLIKSTDGGKNWHLVAQDQPLGCWLTVDPLDPQIVHVAGENFAKSTDGGITWTSLNTRSLTPVVIDPLNPQMVYAGTFNGVLKSTDGGNNWSTLNEGLPDLNVPVLLIDPTTPRILYAAPNGGGVFHLEQQDPISVTDITPNFGSTRGGTVVAITGDNFLAGASVLIGGTPAADVTVVDATTLTATTPPGTAGTANVVVINPGCAGAPSCSATLANAFTYVAPPPPNVSLTQDALDFGEVKVGKRRKVSFKIHNLSEERQTLQLSTTLPFSLRSSATVTVKPGRRKKVKVQFTPTSAGTFTGTVEVVDLATGGSLSVPVSGVGGDR
ncbi:MAG: IPT/TIG domain-containing protein [Candidatus Binatia bacterium]